MLWAVIYITGNTYKTKYVKANTSTQAIKKARIKNIVELYPMEVNEK